MRHFIYQLKRVKFKELIQIWKLPIAMIERRGRWQYFLKYKQGKKRIKETGYIGEIDYLQAIIPQLAVSLMPSKMRLLVFTKLLR